MSRRTAVLFGTTWLTVLFVANACREMLKRNHNQRDYEIVVPLELMLRREETKRIFNIVLGSIAGISLLVGGIIGASIFLVPADVAREVGSPGLLVATWVLSGLLAACGALCFAALAAAIQQATDVRMRELPMSPPKLLRQIIKQRSGGNGKNC